MHRTLTDALRWHLTYNCYPPSQEFLALAEQAVLACVQDDGGSRILEAPPGMSYTGPDALTAGRVVRQLHLDDYVAMLAEEEEEEEEAEEPVEEEEEWVWPMPDPPR